jgi:nucleotide-binding universal stress UspA family protein
MNTILVPLDGSTLAEQVLPYARELALLLGADLRLVQALADVEPDNVYVEPLVGVYGVAEPPDAYRERMRRVWDGLRQRAEGYLWTRAMELQEPGLPVATEVLVGPPAEVLVEEGRSCHAGLIMMATHGYGGLKRWTLGSVTDKVVHMATTPVFVVRGDGATPAAHTTIKRILVPLDGSEFAEQALPLAIDLASGANAELILLKAIAPAIETMAAFRPLGRPIPQYGEILEMMHWQARHDLELLADQLRQRGLQVKTAAMNGHAAEVIIDEAALREVDLIVMATHGYSGLKRWALGSVANTVLHTTTTPLVLVRAQATTSQREATDENVQLLEHER